MNSQNPEVIVGIPALQKFLNERGYPIAVPERSQRQLGPSGDRRRYNVIRGAPLRHAVVFLLNFALACACLTQAGAFHICPSSGSSHSIAAPSTRPRPDIRQTRAGGAGSHSARHADVSSRTAQHCCAVRMRDVPVSEVAPSRRKKKPQPAPPDALAYTIDQAAHAPQTSRRTIIG
jgi:hypothetical protein